VEVDPLLAAAMARKISSVGCHAVSLLRIISSRTFHIPLFFKKAKKNMKELYTHSVRITSIAPIYRH